MKNFRMRLTLVVACWTLGAASIFAQGLDDGWVFGGNTLLSGSSAEFTREFSASKTYIIVADGQTGAEDVDIEILDPRRSVIASDMSAKRQARVVFRPAFTASYTIRITLARGTGKPLCYYLVFVESGGWDISVETLTSVLAKVDGAVIAASDVMGAIPERFYGYILHPSQTNSLWVQGLEGEYVAFAVGSDHAYDIDLTIRRNGQIIQQDIGPDPIPICTFSNYLGAVEIEARYVSGRGPAVVVVGLCKKTLPELRRL